MKKYIFLLLSFFCFLFPVQAIDLETYSKNILLYNLDENTVLYEKSSDEKIAIASLTKLMTAVVAIENISSLDQKVKLTAKDFEGLMEANASVAGFRMGQNPTYRDLLYGLLLPSGADAALALARNVAGSREHFVEMMNEKAKELGLINTHFVNETGLDAKNHYSTLKEVAILFQYALKNEELSKIIKSDRYTMSDRSFTVRSSISKNIKRYSLSMDYLLGGKTGTTDAAGLCLASIASNNGTNYMLITARAPYDKKAPYHFYDAKTIYEYFMSHYENKKVIESGEILLTLATQYAKEDKVNFKAKEDILKYVPKSFDKKDLVYTYDGVDTISYKNKVGEKLGILQIKYKDDLVFKIDIVLEQELSFDLMKYVKDHLISMIGLFIALSVSFIFFCICRKRKKRGKYRKKITSRK